MKARISQILTIMLVVALVAGAICIGGVKGYKEEREELLLSCIAKHSDSSVSLSDGITDCEKAAADFDARLKYKLMGKAASTFGVEPVTESVTALHAQLIQAAAAQSAGQTSQTPDDSDSSRTLNEVITDSVNALHTQLLQTASTVTQTSVLFPQLGSQVNELLEDSIDTKLSLGKVFWTIVLLWFIFGKQARRKGITLGKLFAGLGLFSIWKKK